MSLGAAAFAPAAVADDALLDDAVSGGPVAPLALPTDNVNISVVTMNDFHGRIEAGGSSAGAAVMAGAVQEFRSANPNTIFAAAGDLIGASTFTSFIQEDVPTIDALNAAGLEVSAAGNHEFDHGWADLKDRVLPLAQWKYLSANVTDRATNAPALDPFWVKELDGVRVGFIGAVTEDLYSLVPPTGIASLRVDPIVESVNRAAQMLTDGDDANGEADVIILLVHEGAATVEMSSITAESPLGQIVDGVDDSVDAIVSAHTHLAYNHVIDGRPVISAGQYGENVGLMTITYDKANDKLVSISNEIKPLQTRDAEGRYVPNYPAVPAVQTIVDDAVAAADIPGAKPVGEISADFNRARQTNGSENRGGESTIGNFVADVHRWATNADIAFMNPGGIRENLVYASTGAADPDGNVSFREAANVQPFANNMMTVTLTGAQVTQLLEEQWQPEGASRPFLKLGVSGNLTYTYDPSAPKGSHITEVLLNGAPIDPAASFTVAANGFLAGGGDNFVTFAAGSNPRDTGISDLQTMVDWFTEHGTAVPDTVQRAVGVAVNVPAASAGFAAGEDVVIDLSSLAFSTNEQHPTEAVLSLDGKVVASALVDLSIVDATDETGRATLRFATPAGLTGTHVLRVQTDTGTSVQVPVMFAAETGGSGAADGGNAGSDGAGNNGSGSSGAGGDGSTGPSTGKGSGGLAATGGDAQLPLGMIAALLLLAGAGVFAARSVATHRARKE